MNNLPKRAGRFVSPQPVTPGKCRRPFKGLYDVCSALRIKQKVVGNDMFADQKEIVFITVANQGGQSTFLRSIGPAQLMMQCGMFVPAETFCASLNSHLFALFKWEEDTTMESGKLDEELSWMSDLVDRIGANSPLLINESFAATNEREVSEIARQIIRALLGKHIRIFFVIYLPDLAQSLYGKKMKNALFLHAGRQADGTRTFRIVEGKPLQTSFGADLNEQIFGTAKPKPQRLSL